MAQITFKVASMADISFLVTKIIFAMAEKIISKENVITSYVSKITFIVAEIICEVAIVTYSVT